MRVTQISVFLENKCGRLAKVASVLGKNNVNIRALSIADTSDFGILRLIVDKPPEALKVLKDEGFAVSETDVLAVEVEDTPGGLAKTLEVFNGCKANIEYMYAFVGNLGKNAIVVFKVEDIDSIGDFLKDAGVKLLTTEEVARF
jgi:hypothetical protein